MIKLDLNKSLPLGLTLFLSSQLFLPQSSSAAILRFFGFGFSDNETYQKIVRYADAAGNICGFVPVPQIGCTVLNVTTVVVKVVDPPAERILSGKVTIDFDPSNKLIATGWYGEFGANPLLPAPIVGSSSFDQNLLQFNSNPALISSNIALSTET